MDTITEVKPGELPFWCYYSMMDEYISYRKVCWRMEIASSANTVACMQRDAGA
jgi:hypothetical protein